MAMTIEKVGTHVDHITHINPVDVSSVRDPGMKALILLAASLGWNVIQKVNNPVMIVARDGTQKRLPTNTSIRMSVYQTALSTIMLHSEGVYPTTDLIDAIVKTTKIDRDHERRMRLAIGETPQRHRARLESEAASQRREPEEHLTQRIEVPTTFRVDEPDKPKQAAAPQKPKKRAPQKPPAVVFGEAPFDGGSHGAMVSRKPFIAYHHGDMGSETTPPRTMVYESDTSFERVWEDGYKDYECMVCGRIFRHPKSVGAHRQVHTKSGEIPRRAEPLWKTIGKTRLEGEYTPREKRRIRTPKPKVVAEPEVVVEPEPEVAVDQGKTHFYGDDCQPPHEPPSTAQGIIDEITLLIAPNLIREQERLSDENAELVTQNALLRGELDQLQRDWTALKELLGGR